MARPIRFSQIPYVRPDMDQLQADFATLFTTIAHADGPALVQAVKRWNELAFNYLTMNHLSRIHSGQDINDEAAREEQAFFINARPRMREWETQVRTLLISHSCRGAISEAFGEAILRNMESDTATFDPRIADHLKEESRLVLEYQSIKTSSRVDCLGKTYPLTQLRRFDFDSDRQVRHQAARARDRFLLQNASEFDRIFDELVLLRDEMAHTLGLRNYVEYAFLYHNRNSYGPAEVAAFRQQALQQLVPCATDLRHRQAVNLKVDQLMPWDRDVFDDERNLRPLGGVQFIVDRVGKMFNQLSPELSSFFQLMNECELFDLEAREGKASGGSTYFLHDYKLPFIFINLNGSRLDVRMLLHEIGHAFQKYCCRDFLLGDYIWPSKDVAEIHSIGCELLSFPWMDLFFGDDADRYRFSQLMDTVFLIPHICHVDEFQEFVYTNPHCGPEARRRHWLELEAKFEPHLRHGDLEARRLGHGWQHNRLIYARPFYYIDYALAATCALQLWERSEHDHAAAFADYLTLCKAGGSLPYSELLHLGGLRSPFEPGVLEGGVQLVRDWIDRTGNGHRAATAHG